MIINGVYVKNKIIARMHFVPQVTHRADRSEIRELNSHADILTTTKSQIEVVCTQEQYLSALSYLSNKPPPTPDLNLYERVISILEDVDEGLGEWQGVESVHCPEELQPLKKAQEEIKEIIHDLEVSE